METQTLSHLNIVIIAECKGIWVSETHLTIISDIKKEFIYYLVHLYYRL